MLRHTVKLRLRARVPLSSSWAAFLETMRPFWHKRWRFGNTWRTPKLVGLHSEWRWRPFVSRKKACLPIYCRYTVRCKYYISGLYLST